VVNLGKASRPYKNHEGDGIMENFTVSKYRKQSFCGNIRKIGAYRFRILQIAELIFGY
jgi:hypothetical protein